MSTPCRRSFSLETRFAAAAVTLLALAAGALLLDPPILAQRAEPTRGPPAQQQRQPSVATGGSQSSMQQPHAGWERLLRRIEAHVETVHFELHDVLARACPGVGALPSPFEQVPGNLTLPSCEALAEMGGLERYYSQMMFLLVEAWANKILPTVHGFAQSHASGLFAELITVEDEGRLAGAVFVLELETAGATGERTAMLLGIHRMPRHRARRVARELWPEEEAASLEGGGSTVLDSLVSKARGWCRSRSIDRLCVCPYSSIQSKLERMGFRRVPDPSSGHRFGPLDLRRDVCEEAELWGVMP